MRIYKCAVLILCIEAVFNLPAIAQKLSVQSPNQRINVSLFNEQNSNSGEWYLKVSYVEDGKSIDAISRIDLGLVRADQEFAKELAFVKTGKITPINEQYTAVHGKRLVRSNSGNEVSVSFQNPDKTKMNVIIRAYNDGMAFRYEFPDKREAIAVKDELTSYNIPKEASRWMEKWNTANEGYYTAMSDDKVLQQEWCYPALFNTKDKACWFLLHEADLDRNYCGTKLSNVADVTKYKLAFPNPRDGRGTGVVEPTITFPWKSPWRVVIMGKLQDVVASTLADDISTPTSLKNTDWIKPGVASWNYWSSNHGTKDYKIVTAFADLAAEMNWPYTLIDWEWDSMGNGGNLEDALVYIKAKGVKPLMWYNSGGNHTTVTSTPKDRMLTHESRVKEFTRLNELGVVGVKIDFFESEKQNMIQYYLDILDDAAKHQIMVYFHGCLVPRGWARTYPHLVTYEAVRGAEWYNNVPDFTMAAPEHNTILPFTRNVIGAMDYTPVTFTNSQYPHVTSYGHELALSVLFESAIQHLADRPEGYNALPHAPKAFLRAVPAAWDDTKLVDGYPGKDVTMARQKGNDWYLAGINGEQREKRKTIKLDFLAENVKYRLTLIADGAHDKAFATQYMVVDKSSSIDVKMLRRGGFAASIVRER